jgi:hypothetical protein
VKKTRRVTLRVANFLSNRCVISARFTVLELKKMAQPSLYSVAKRWPLNRAGEAWL